MKNLSTYVNKAVDTRNGTNQMASTTNIGLERAERMTDTKPTKKEIKKETYEKGLFIVQGFSIRIENPKGSTRSGTDESGKKWSVEMVHSYGYFDRTEGKDGDQVDVFIGPNPDSRLVFIVDQVIDGKFDEHKVMLGFDTKNAASRGYMVNYDENWDGKGAITEMTISEFRVWLGGGTRTKTPASQRLQIQLGYSVKPSVQTKNKEIMKSLKESLNEASKYKLKTANADSKKIIKDFPYLKKVLPIEELPTGDGFTISTKWGQEIYVLEADNGSILVGYEDNLEMFMGIENSNKLRSSIIGVAAQIEEDNQ